jgi:phosphonate ABC transporter permease subunit PhnE
VNEAPTSTTDPTEEKKQRHTWVRPLMILLGVFAVVVVYAFGFEKTDVDLEEIKSETRREQLVRIIRGLAHPDIIEFEQQETFVTLEVAVPCPPGGYEPPAPEGGGPYLVMTPTCADPETDVVVEGFDFPPGTRAPLSFIPNVEGIALKLADVTVGEDGTFAVEVELPERPDEEPQQLRITTKEQTGSWTWSKNARETWDKIIETVMLALMATTLGIAVGIPLSFFSARNLMRPIRTPMLAVALFLLGIPLGIYGGTLFGRFISGLGADIAGVSEATGIPTQPGFLAIVLAATLLAGWLALRYILSQSEDLDRDLAWRVGRVASWLVLVALALFAVLLAGYLLMWVGDAIRDPLDEAWLGFLAGFLVTIGDILSTFMTAGAAILAAFAGAFAGSRLGHSIVDRLPKSTVRILRYPAGAVAVAIVALGIGGAVNWLYEYEWSNQAIPATAGALLGALGGGIVFGRLARRASLRWGGSGAGFVAFLAGLVGIVGGGAVGLAIGHFAERVASPFDAGSIVSTALVGAAFGLLLAWATRRLDALPSGLATYYVSRSLFNGIRSVEPLVMAIVFVVWVGIGPFAGSLALALHTVAALAKLYSEQVESILTGPVEAVTATGATRLQNVVYAVVPQIVPPYIAFTLYRWDINVRMSTIIGFAGGGGIGFLLQQNINLLQYRAASVQMLAIAVVVSTLDFVSARIRERIV